MRFNFLNKRKKSADYLFRNTLERIELGVNRFEYGQDLSIQALNDIDELLKYCSEKNIYVTGFLPPYANRIYRCMINRDDKYAYINKIYPALNRKFSKYNYQIYDFSDVHACNSNDNEVIDGFHGSEVSYAKLLCKIASQNKIINNFVDTEKIKKLLKSKKNDFYLTD